MSKAERSGGAMLEKLTTGEYALAYLISGITVFPKLADPARKAVIDVLLQGPPADLSAPDGDHQGRAQSEFRELLLDHACRTRGKPASARAASRPCATSRRKTSPTTPTSPS